MNKENELKILRFINDRIFQAIGIVMLVVLLLGVYYMADVLYVYYRAEDRKIFSYRPSEDNTEILKDLSEDAVAWVRINDTDIDYPIMQGEDNSKYLNTDPYGDFSLSGSIFLDARNNPGFADTYSLVYGHHMDHGAMFGALDPFLGEEYLSEHTEGEIFTADGHVYDLHIFASSIVNVKIPEIFHATECDGNAEWIAANADTFFEPQDEEWKERVVALTTCTSADTTDRTCVFGWLSEAKDIDAEEAPEALLDLEQEEPEKSEN